MTIFDEKPLIIPGIYIILLWRNLWIMWKSSVEKDRNTRVAGEITCRFQG